MKKLLQQAGEKALEEAKLTLAENGTVLPRDCWLSGQWFALATLKHAGLWNKDVVMNDIDVFNISEYDPHTDSGLIEKRESFFKIEPVLMDPYKNRTYPGRSNSSKYRVVETAHYGILNLTNVKFTGESECEGYDLISKFDINSTQCAINTTTKKVVFTDHFVEFAKNQELKIVEMTTLGHSIVRLLKKADELECFVDIEKETQKLLFEDQFVPFFGEMIYNKFLPYEDVLTDLGIVVEEVKIFDKQVYKLYQMKRQSNLIDDAVEKWYGFFKPESLCEFVDFTYKHTTESLEEFAKKYDDVGGKEAQVVQKVETYLEITLINRFFTQKGFSFEKFETLLEKIEATDTYIFAVNCFLDWSEIDKWLEALSPKYEHFLLTKNEDAYHGETISIDEVIKNPNPFSLEELIEDAPKIGESESSPRVIGSIKTAGEVTLVIEMEKKENIIEYFGYNIDSMMWEQQATSKAGIYRFFEPEKEHLLLKTSDVSVEVPKKYKEISVEESNIPDIEIDPSEIPF